MNDRQPLTAAERQRRYRQRQKLGLRIFCVEVDDQGIARLIDAGLLNENEAFSDENISDAISRLVGSPNGIEQ